jgi:hypothetical protein
MDDQLHFVAESFHLSVAGAIMSQQHMAISNNYRHHCYTAELQLLRLHAGANGDIARLTCPIVTVCNKKPKSYAGSIVYVPVV